MLYVMCGPSGSGKSTWALNERLKNPKLVIVSTDEIRKELFDNASYQYNPEMVFSIAYTRVRRLLEMKYDVIFDAMNITRYARREVLRQFHLYNPVCVVMATSIDECIRRQTDRERKVKSSVIEEMFKRFVRPTLDEGWNEIREI